MEIKMVKFKKSECHKQRIERSQSFPSVLFRIAFLGNSFLFFPIILISTSVWALGYESLLSPSRFLQFEDHCPSLGPKCGFIARERRVLPAVLSPEPQTSSGWRAPVGIVQKLLQQVAQDCVLGASELSLRMGTPRPLWATCSSLIILNTNIFIYLFTFKRNFLLFSLCSIHF